MSENAAATTEAATTPAPKAPVLSSFSRDFVDEIGQECDAWKSKANGHKGEAEAARRELEAFKASVETEKAQLRADADARLIRAEMKARALAAGMVDIDGLKLLDTSAVKLGEDGEVRIPDDFFANAREAKPYLFGAVNSTSSTQAAPAGEAKPVNAMELSDADYPKAKAAALRLASSR